MKIDTICVILFIILLITMIITYMELKRKIHENFNSPLNINDIYKYSLMVHLENDKLSKKRLDKMKKIYIKYNLPLNIFPALHWKKDENIINNLPILRNKPQMWEGAWGLAGSFYRALNHAYKNNYPYLLFLEDDSIPIYDDPATFYRIVNHALKNLPEDGNDVYFLGFTVYCKLNNKKKRRGWVKRYDIPLKYIAGGHSILFSKNSIIKIMNYLKNKKIDKPIDDWIKYLEKMKLINIWYWEGDLSKNNMFCGLFRQLDTGCKSRISVLGRHSTK